MGVSEDAVRRIHRVELAELAWKGATELVVVDRAVTYTARETSPSGRGRTPLHHSEQYVLSEVGTRGVCGGYSQVPSDVTKQPKLGRDRTAETVVAEDAVRHTAREGHQSEGTIGSEQRRVTLRSTR